MSPYDAYEQARKEYGHLPRRMVRSLDLIAGRALCRLGVNPHDIHSLLTTYPDGKTRDRIVAAYQHHINQTMNKTKERQAMKYALCSTCKNEPYQAGAGGPCATCGQLVDNETGQGTGTSANWYPKINAEFAKAQAPIERALATQVGGAHYKDMPIQPVEFITKNGLGFLEGCVIKRVCRWKAKDGVQDLRKAIHEIELLIEMEAKP